jgi:DNA gyrase subunit A
MTRRWPAADVAPLIALIDDPRHRINEDGTYNLSEEQARAILELRLQRLTALGRDEIGDELNKLGKEIEDYLDILRSRVRIQDDHRDRARSVRDRIRHAAPDRDPTTVADFDDEDLIAREDMVVTVSHAGYIKRVPLSTYRAQKRGGKGRSGMSTRDEDFVTRLFVANTHTPMLFFSSPRHRLQAQGLAPAASAAQCARQGLINILPLEQGERITTIMPLPEDEESWGNLDVMFATTTRQCPPQQALRLRRGQPNGKIAMKLDEGDHRRRRDLHRSTTTSC